MNSNPFAFLFGNPASAWKCSCGHGVTRHCTSCGVCHVGQQGGSDPFFQWCGCMQGVPTEIYMIHKGLAWSC